MGLGREINATFVEIVSRNTFIYMDLVRNTCFFLINFARDVTLVLYRPGFASKHRIGIEVAGSIH